MSDVFNGFVGNMFAAVVIAGIGVLAGGLHVHYRWSWHTWREILAWSSIAFVTFTVALVPNTFTSSAMTQERTAARHRNIAGVGA